MRHLEAGLLPSEQLRRFVHVLMLLVALPVMMVDAGDAVATLAVWRLCGWSIERSGQYRIPRAIVTSRSSSW